MSTVIKFMKWSRFVVYFIVALLFTIEVTKIGNIPIWIIWTPIPLYALVALTISIVMKRR